MSYEINISDSIEELSEQFAQLLINQINEGKENFNLALSGGSTPRAVYRYLADNYSPKIEWGRIRLFFCDERCVPPDHQESNYKMALDNLISGVEIPSGNIFRIHGEENPSEEVINYSEILSTHLPSENGYPRFDMVLLGIGKDGHTASIFPGSLDLFTSQDYCAVAEHPVTLQKRITLTGNIINNSACIVFLVTGSNKSKIVDAILNHKYGYGKLPASLVDPSDGKLIWLLDKSAGRYCKYNSL